MYLLTMQKGDFVFIKLSLAFSSCQGTVLSFISVEQTHSK